MLSRGRAAMLVFSLLLAACTRSSVHKALDAGAEAFEPDASDAAIGPCSIGTAGPRCGVCPAGSFCPGGTTPMALCATNTFDDDQDPKTPCIAASSCPAGSYVALPYSRVTDQRCATCPTGGFSSEVNTRTCSDYRKCNEGEFISAPGSATEDLVCQRTRACNTAEYERLAPARDRDRECAPLTICTPGQYVSTQPTATTDRSCKECATGLFSASDNAGACVAWRMCDAQEIESQVPSGTRDRECECQTSSDEDAGSAASTCPDP